MTDQPNAQAALTVRFGQGGNACVVFLASKGEGPRSGSVPTLVGALLASSLARMGRGPQSDRLLTTVERSAALFASMSQPNVLPPEMKLVHPEELADAQTVCTVLIPSEGKEFVRSVFSSDDADVAYKAFLYALQYAIDNLAPETLVALSSVLRGVAARFRGVAIWPDAATIERELADGKAGISR